MSPRREAGLAASMAARSAAEGGQGRRPAAQPKVSVSHHSGMSVVAAIEELPEDLRTAITLRELEGMSYEDIAVTMECPIGTVRSRIFRAREAINRRLEPLM